MKVAVIADDFTGASDTGVQFSKRGLQVCVLLQSMTETGGGTEGDVLVLDTDSRSLDAGSAYLRAAQASLKAQAFGADLVLKKIDSTLRGNIGAEIDAVYDTFRPDFVIIAPSFPEMGRLVRQGTLYVHGMPLQDTEFARDPKTPVTGSYIPDLLRKQTKRPVEVIPSALVEKGRSGLEPFLRSCISRGSRYFVADSADDGDLRRMVSLIGVMPDSVVWAGSAGLARHLSEQVPASRQLELPTNRKAAGPVLVVIGSVSSRSRRQLDVLLSHPRVRGIRVEAFRLISGQLERERELIHAVGQAELALCANFHTVIYASGDREDIRLAQETGRRNGLDTQQVSDEVARALGESVSRLLQRAGVCGIIMTGGDTAKQICAALQTNEFRLVDEVESGIPAGLLVMDKPLPAVTKAGGFGSDHALVSALELLNRGIGTR
ncbi:four-carbon acid sugar kinase family protein [Paenibacillus sedimenti]|uniref:Four-carbon acid sugar kinase family protein n=1 Tax=Paenibacillus sedimenti TaxID=2770274 RepID=A0A926KJ19_9BACL|nr:four-carbon acid sugar kinase family protein [Paenibacillus sedimenti]MBD0378619.1 four-carbon acid sugar kinase family protein [Paenibacillus sedimenti]